MPLITLGRYEGIFDYPYQVPLDGFRSAFIVGMPGTGKSILQARIIEDAVAAGCGVLGIDPHGDTVENLARRTRFPDRLVYVAPGLIGDRCYGLNPLADVAADPDRAAMTVLDLFSRLGQANPETRIVNYILGLVTRTVLNLPHPTLLAARWLLTDEKFRQWAIKDPKLDEMDAQFWKNFKGRSAYNKSQWLDSTDRRLGELLASHRIAASLSQPIAPLPWGDLLDDGKMILVNLRDGMTPEHGLLFGNIILAIITRAALSRPEGRRGRTWMVVVDEAQRLAPDSLADLYVEGRKYRCFPALGTQTVKRLEREAPVLAEAVGTAAVRVTLTISGADRVIYAAESGIERAEEVRDLAAWHGMVERPHGFEHKPERTPITLEEWWPAPNQAQRDAALAASLVYTTPLPERAVLFARPGWARDTKGGNDTDEPEPARIEETPPTAPGADPPEPGALELSEVAGGDDPGAGDDARRDPPLPFSERPRRSSTLLPGRGGGARQGRETGGNGDQGGERDVPDPPEG